MSTNPHNDCTIRIWPSCTKKQRVCLLFVLAVVAFPSYPGRHASHDKQNRKTQRLHLCFILAGGCAAARGRPGQTKENAKRYHFLPVVAGAGPQPDVRNTTTVPNLYRNAQNAFHFGQPGALNIITVAYSTGKRTMPLTLGDRVFKPF